MNIYSDVNKVKMMNETALIYLSDSYFPFGTAYASRVLHICKAFQMIRCDTYVLADHTKEQLDRGNYGIHENINYYIIEYSSLKEKYKITCDYIDSIKVRYSKVVIVLGAHDTYRYHRIIQRYESRNTRVVLECCEWYDISSFKLRNIDPRYWSFNYSIKHIYPHSKYTISISKYLTQYFKALNSDACVIRVPTILDVSNIDYNIIDNNSTIRIMFAGILGKGKKETFSNFLTALSYYDEYVPLEIAIFGGSIENLRFNLGDNQKILDKIIVPIKCYGVVDQNQIELEYKKSDYSIIFRPDRRSSHAGFPTKLAESMAAGTPVIANDTGDIGAIIDDGKNGFICENNSYAIKECLDRILKLSNEEKKNIRRNARAYAEEHFDYKNYLSELELILEGF